MSYFSLFQSTHPARGATRSGFLTPTVDQFQSTHPARGATIAAISSGLSTSFQSTHPARGATVRRPPFCFHFDISIHAPREGCDSLPSAPATTSTYFNPRTPARGATTACMHNIYGQSEFQSTHPARGATPYWCVLARPAFHFNPRTPRGVRQVADGPPGDCVIISIHAPREGCDKAPLAGGTKERNFNPRTPRGVRRDGMSAPMRGGDFNPRTPRGVRRSVMRSSICSNSISIHAPREGCDTGRPMAGASSRLFQSTHPARGATLTAAATSSTGSSFQSTHPARGATTQYPKIARRKFYFNPRTPRGVRLLIGVYSLGLRSISIHAPREGCDVSWYTTNSLKHQFQSTHPARGATLSSPHRPFSHRDFNPRTPRGVRPVCRSIWEVGKKISIHAPREGCDPCPTVPFMRRSYFNPRTPRWVRLRLF